MKRAAAHGLAVCLLLLGLTSEAKGANGMTVTWLECVAAGDYRWLEILPGGEAEVLRAGPDLHVFEVRRGRPTPAAIERVRRLTAAADLSALRSYYPFTPREGVVVEPAYDSVAAGAGSLVNVVAHERARPPALEELVKALGELAAEVPVAPDRAAPRIVALPVENLVCLGEDAREVDVEMVQPASLRALLRNAVGNEGRSVQLPARDLAALASRVFGGARLLRARSGGKSFAVLLLASEPGNAPAP